jgi:hypothetical protein
MNPDNGCKDRNSCKGEKEIPMNTIFSYMNLQNKNRSVFRIQLSYMELLNTFSVAPGKLMSNHSIFTIIENKICWCVWVEGVWGSCKLLTLLLNAIIHSSPVHLKNR